MANKAGIYVHIPFCVRKCNYCAFLSYPANDAVREEYVNALVNQCKEYFTLDNEICKANFTSIDTIYIGGGTPSLLTPEQIERILSSITGNSLSKNQNSEMEITLEANPGTLGTTDEEILARLKAYRDIGINRLSMGVQSMDDDKLKYLGRIHTADDVRRDFRLAREAGFDNISLDVILSVPTDGYLTGADPIDPVESSLSDVAAIVELGPEHISCYSLQLEEGTHFFEMYENGEFSEVTDEIDREIYHKTCDYLKAHGYEHYEISNFAKPGRKSRHNSKYWDMSEYIAFGLGASGFVSGTRYTITEDMQEYIDGKYIASEHVNSEHDNISEAVFLGLRRREGIKYEEIAQQLSEQICKVNFTSGTNESREWFWQYYADVHQKAQSFADSGHLIIDAEGIRLTEQGIDISNTIMALFV